MISKQEFVNIINKLREVNDFVDETNNNARKLNDALISDFFNASSLSISHEIIVVDLLQHIFNDKYTLGWWLFELDYGRKYTKGCFTEADGTEIDVSTAEKLYEYLINKEN